MYCRVYSLFYVEGSDMLFWCKYGDVFSKHIIACVYNHNTGNIKRWKIGGKSQKKKKNSEIFVNEMELHLHITLIFRLQK